MAARVPTMTPTVRSQAEKLAQVISAVRQYAISVSKVPTKQAIGMVTSMGWMGWPAMLAVDRGLSMRKLLSTLQLGFNSAKRGMFRRKFSRC
jgi:hypothetical protein